MAIFQKHGKSKIIISIIAFILPLLIIAIIVSALAPTITFLNPTPSSGTSSSNTTFDINASIASSSLSEMQFNWNGTNYTFYDSSLVLKLDFDNRSALDENDSVVFDSSIYGLNGTVRGLINADINQTWLEFDGVDDHINVPDSYSIKNLSQLTISFFVKPISLSTKATTTGILLDKFKEYTIYYNNNTGLVQIDTTNLSDSWMNTGKSLVVNRWNHIVFQYNGTGKNFYLNGARVIESATGTTGNLSNNLTIGARITAASPTNFFNGSISKVRLYTYPLSFWQVMDLNYTENPETIKNYRIPQLTYHEIRDYGDCCSVYITNFTEQSNYLRSNGYVSITFSNYTSIRSLAQTSQKRVFIVFDDGPKSVYVNAYPVMNNNSQVGIIGVITSMVGRNNTGSENNSYSTWEELRNLSDNGWEIASHSINSTRFSDMDYNSRIYAFNRSRWDIYNNISVMPITFIFPGNDQNSTIRNECLSFYTYCTGADYPEDNPKYIYYNSVINYTSAETYGGLNRINIRNYTNIENYKRVINVDYNSTLILKFNENTGTTAYDTSGNANNGTISGATWANETTYNYCPLYTTPGKYDGAFEFDGINDYVEINDSDMFSANNVTGDLTISFWLKVPSFRFNGTDGDSGYIEFIGKGRTGDNNPEWGLRIYNSSAYQNKTCRLSLYFWNITGGEGAGAYIQNNNSEYGCTNLENRWMHVLGTVNDTRIKLYLDGVPNADSPSNLLSTYGIKAGMGNGNSSVKIGTRALEGFLNGSIDEFMIWNRTLTNAEVQELYASRLNKFNSSQWYFYTNRSSLKETTYSYQIHAKSGSDLSSSSLMSYQVDCSIPTEGMFTNTTNICPGTYLFNGSANGVLRPSANHVVINCNGAKFIGNYSDNKANSVPLFAKPSGFTNVTFKNCNIQNYYTGISFKSTETKGEVQNCTFNSTYQSIDITTGRNILIANNTFLQSDYYGIYLEPNSNLWHNITIDSNYFTPKVNRQIRAEGHTVSIAKGLTVIRNALTNGTIYVSSIGNVTITNNSVHANYSSAVLDSQGMYLLNVYNVTVTDNQVSGWDSGIAFLTSYRYLDSGNWFCGNLSSPVLIKNNTVFNNDRGMRLRGIKDATISYNTFKNNTDGVDAYDVALYFEECSQNVLVDKNNFSQTGSTAIFAQDMDGLTITNNTFDMLSDSEKTARLVNDIYEYPAAISIKEMYKQFVQGNRTSQPENLTFVSSMKSNNITIKTNTFDSHTQVFLMLQGTTNCSHDLNLANYWYRKWSPMTHMMDPIEHFISNSYSRIYWTNSLGAIKDLAYYGYGNITAVPIFIEYNFTNSWEYFKNINATGTFTLARYNLTNSLIYYSNYSLVSSLSAKIDSNDGNISVILAPGNSTYILDNFNFTEGVSRQYSPLWLSSSSKSLKQLSSNLTQSINTTVVMSIDSCGLLKHLEFKNSSGTATTYSLTSNAETLYCKDAVLTVNATITPGSNNITLTYDASNTGGGGTTGGGSYDWACTPWGPCINGITTRNCIGGIYNKPPTQSNCIDNSDMNNTEQNATTNGVKKGFLKKASASLLSLPESQQKILALAMVGVLVFVVFGILYMVVVR